MSDSDDDIKNKKKVTKSKLGKGKTKHESDDDEADDIDDIESVDESADESDDDTSENDDDTSDDDSVKSDNSDDSFSDSDSNYSTSDDSESDTKSVCSVMTDLSSRSRQSKNVMKIYNQNREKICEQLLKSSDKKTMKLLYIDVDNLRDDYYTENISNAYYTSFNFDPEYTQNYDMIGLDEDSGKTQKCVWESDEFDEIRKVFEYESDLIENPPEISEGGVPCLACGCEKTIIFQYQKRSADEPMNTKIFCMNKNCKRVTIM